jgi:hypothetical protein
MGPLSLFASACVYMGRYGRENSDNTSNGNAIL